ncbi:hypothetical protein AMTR_s00033p00227300 [Amborella trichopoda]|uniref:Uncharacterized protein n=1 Tax=Amborella trichopoda TaxID=13333 RepID=U5CWN7_AMBTC|nr:hypothetical protein AMTR_s00033p00227300 [Amborella trichopoda]
MVNDIQRDHDVMLSYQQAWQGKEVVQHINDGSPVKSYEDLAKYLHKIGVTNSETLTIIQTDDHDRFERVFISNRPCLYSFMFGCRPLTELDETFLKGRCKDILLDAVGAREKHVIKLLECLRVKLIGEFSKKMTMSLGCSCVLTPKAQNVIDLRRNKSRFLHTVTWAHDDHRHEDVTNFCGVYFIVQIYRRAYSVPYNPMLDVLQLPKIVYTTGMPPATRRTAGRSKKRHMKTEFKEIRPLKCSRCGVVGHT